MDRQQLTEVANGVADGDIFGAALFLKFLCCEKDYTQLKQELLEIEREGTRWMGGSSVGGWDRAAVKARNQVQLLTALVPGEDLRTAYRYLEYLIYANPELPNSSQ